MLVTQAFPDEFCRRAHEATACSAFVMGNRLATAPRESTRLQQTEGYPFNPRKWAVPQTDPQPWPEYWWTSVCAIRRLSMPISGQAPEHDAPRHREFRPGPVATDAFPWQLLLCTLQSWHVAGPRETLKSSPGLPLRMTIERV